MRSAQSEKVDMKEMGNQSQLGLADAALLFDVVGHVGEGVALGEAALVGDVFVAGR